MTLQNVEIATKTPLCNMADREFEAGLAALMPFLRARAGSLARNRELAEDIAQAALAKAWRSRNSFAPDTNLKAWLFTILRNEFYSYKRSAWRQIPWDAEWAETMSAPHGEQQWACELSDTARAMRALPDNQRDALILVGVGGYSYEDAALVSRAPVGTMKSRVGRARKFLRTNLESRGSLPDQSRPARGDAMNEIIAQLSHLMAANAPRVLAKTAIH